MSLLANVFNDITNWIRGWDKVVFAIVVIAFVMIALALFTHLIKGFVGGKTKFHFVSLIFLVIIVGLIIYICLAR